MRVVWSNVAKKELSKIDARYRERIKAKFSDINDRSAPRSDIRKMTTPDNHFRMRVGDYRIIFTMRGEDQDECYIISVKRRTSTNYLHEEIVPYGRSNYQR